MDCCICLSAIEDVDAALRHPYVCAAHPTHIECAEANVKQGSVSCPSCRRVLFHRCLAPAAARRVVASVFDLFFKTAKYVGQPPVALSPAAMKQTAFVAHPDVPTSCNISIVVPDAGAGLPPGARVRARCMFTNADITNEVLLAERPVLAPPPGELAGELVNAHMKRIEADFPEWRIDKRIPELPWRIDAEQLYAPTTAWIVHSSAAAAAVERPFVLAYVVDAPPETVVAVAHSCLLKDVLLTGKCLTKMELLSGVFSA